MTLIKFKNESPVRNRERMPMWSEFFNDLFDDVITRPDVRRSTIPSVNVVESDENFRLEVAAPGLDKNDFKITLEGNLLTISSEKENEQTTGEENFSRREFSYQSFQRSFQLPKNVVDEDKIIARYENGILLLSIPKREEAKQKPPRMIEIS